MTDLPSLIHADCMHACRCLPDFAKRAQFWPMELPNAESEMDLILQKKLDGV